MSVSSKAVLVVLSISGIPEPRRQDKKVRAAVAKRHKVDESQVDFQKFLWDPNATSYVALKQWAWKVREWAYAHTTPYAHNGARFLKATEILDYTAQMTKFKAEGEELFGDFLHDLDRPNGLKAKAQKALNGMWDESLYPSKQKLKSRFYVGHDFLPVPDSGHVVLDLVTEDVTEAVKASTEAAVKSATAEAIKDVWVRLHEAVSNMSASLADPDKRFHDTLVSNVKEICDLLPGLNITDDPQLAAMGEQVKKALTKSKPDTLREDEDRRKEVAKKAAELAAKMSAFVR